MSSGCQEVRVIAGPGNAASTQFRGRFGFEPAAPISGDNGPDRPVVFMWKARGSVGAPDFRRQLVEAAEELQRDGDDLAPAVVEDERVSAARYLDDLGHAAVAP